MAIVPSVVTRPTSTARLLRRWAESPDGRSSRLGVIAAFTVVLALGCVSAAARFDVLALDRTIGHSDTAAYAEMGRSLAEGRGLRVGYISSFYYAYDPVIDRRDDHWPPLMGVLIAPFFATLGVSALHAKIPAVLMGALGLPLATTWLGVVVSRRAWVGAAAGLLMIVNRQLFRESLTTLSDVTLAALLTAFCAALVAARARPRAYLAAGALGALAYYAKSSEVMLAGLFPCLALLIAGPRALRQRWMYVGWGLLVAGMLPWQIANLREWGSPLHSAQNHVSGFIGLDVWENRHYHPYWGKDLPTTRDRWTRYADRYWQLVSRQREEYARLVLLGSATGQADWYRLGPLGVTAFALLRGDDIAPALERTEPDTPLLKPAIDRSRDPEASQRAAAAWPALWSRTLREGWTALGGGWRALLDFSVAEHRSTLVPNLLGALYAIAVLIGVPLRGCWRGRFAAELREWPRSWGIVAALVLLGAVHGVLLICFFAVGARFTFPALPVMAVLGATGVAAVARRVGRRTGPVLLRAWPGWAALSGHVAGFAAGMTGVLLVGFAVARAPQLVAWQQADAAIARGFRASPAEALGAWIGRNLPGGGVVMARQPWELRFHSPANVKTVAIPSSEDVRLVLGIAHYYGVTHVVTDPKRPQLTRYLEALGPGVTRLAAPGPLYAIDWSAIPRGDVLLPGQSVDARAEPRDLRHDPA